MRIKSWRGATKWLLALMTLIAGQAAWAAADLEGSTLFVEPNGTYTVDKAYQVYSDTNPDNPNPVAGHFTYVYTLANHSGSLIPVLGFNLEAPAGSIASVGFIDGAGVNPSVSVLGTAPGGEDVASWDFAVDALDPGETSDQLIVISAYSAGLSTQSMSSIDGDFALDTPGTCVGPVNPPVEVCNLEIEKEGCVVQPVSPPGDACEGKVKCFEFEYTGLGCDASSNLQDPKKTLCVGGADGASPVDILISGKKHRRGKRSWFGWWNRHKSKKTFGSYKDVQIGDVIEVCSGHGGKRNLGSSTTIKIKDGNGGHHDILELDKFHTSCSQPFGPGMQFGSVKITSVTSTRGGTVVLEEDPPTEECVTEVDVAEPPHCVGKVTSLTMRYVGGDCGGTMNSQGNDKQGCVDASVAGTYPVRIIVSNGAAAPPATSTYVDVSPVAVGDLFTITPTQSNCGSTDLTSTTGWWIKDAGTNELRSDGYFHTSCSQPLNLGDQFGPLQVYAITSTNGGTASLEHEVTYTYEVTNPNADDATNISVDDDLLGNITSGQTIAAGASATFVTSAFISEETTNIATVTGEVNGLACEPANAAATITVAAPPAPGTICTKKIAAMRVVYTGPDLLGATVEFEAKTFPGEHVVYGPIDLIGGVTELSMPGENGFSIDATAHENTDLGSKTKIFINGVEEEIHTSCSVPFETNKPAPLNNPSGAPSPNWKVVAFAEKS